MVDLMLNGLRYLDSVTLKLQSDCFTEQDARKVFDGVVEKYFIIKERLGERTAIVESTNFEQAVVKVQRGEEGSLNEVDSPSAEG